MIGRKFGSLIVLDKLPPKEKRGHSRWLCRCDCGQEIVVDNSNLRRQTKCKQCASTKHGMTETPLYEVWSHMKQRCLCETDQNYHRYGGRGITVCDEWLSFEPFMEWSLNNGYAPSLTLDRVDNDKGYDPSNCRWADRKTQSNNRSNSLYITANGTTLPCAEWARLTGIPRNTIRGRIKTGWSAEEAVTIKVGEKRNK